MSKLTICGGGNAAHVLMALGEPAGWVVDVFAPHANEAERLECGLAARGGMDAITTGATVCGKPRRVSADPSLVIPGSELVLLALPAFAHGTTLEAIAPYLEPGVAVGALPARSGFDYQARSVLDGATSEVTIFGLQTLPWACRIRTYGEEVEILGTKASVDLAAIPTSQAPVMADLLSPIIGTSLNPVQTFLTLSLSNTGQLIHPGIMYGLCQGKEKATFPTTEVPLFYQGIDEPTAAVLQAMSDEVQAICQAVAAQIPQFDPGEVASLYDWLLQAYPDDILDDSNLLHAFTTNRAYYGLRMPTRPAGPDLLAVDFTARYLAEDVPYGLVVLRGIATLAGVATPVLDQVIAWAEARLGRQYLVDGALTGQDLPATRAPQRYGIKSLAQLLA